MFVELTKHWLIHSYLTHLLFFNFGEGKNPNHPPQSFNTEYLNKFRAEHVYMPS